MLALAAVYAVVDITAGSGLGEALTTMFGPDAAASTREIQEAATQNGRLIGNAAVWSLYWILSRRVFVAFGPAAEARTVSQVEATLPSDSGAAQTPFTSA